MLFTDASDAPQRLGSEVSALYENLKWAGEVKQALANGLEMSIRELQAHRREIGELPASGVPGDLRRELEDELTQLGQRLKQDDFYRHAADFSSLLTHLKTRVHDAVEILKEQQKVRLKESAEDLQRLPEWEELTQEEQGSLTGDLETLLLDASPDLHGLKSLLACDYSINHELSEMKESIRRQGQERRLNRIEEEREKAAESGPVKLKRAVALPARLSTADQLDELIRQLQELKQQMALGAEIELSFTIQE